MQMLSVSSLTHPVLFAEPLVLHDTHPMTSAIFDTGFSGTEKIQLFLDVVLILATFLTICFINTLYTEFFGTEKGESNVPNS